jgi:CheY-like chemotaxis protein
MDEKQAILLAEDSEDDLVLMKSAFRAAGFTAVLREVRNGEEVIAYLKGEGPYTDRAKFPLPAVILLDLKMPKMSGFEVLEWVRSQPVLRRISVMILTASMRAEDIARAADLGANAFLIKPGKVNELITMTLRLRDWLEYNHFPPLQ